MADSASSFFATCSAEELKRFKTSDFGPLPTYCDVRDLVAMRGKADLTRTSDFGRD
jgi:hypothetical protein